MTPDLSSARASQLAEKLQTLRQEAETARLLRDRRSGRPLFTLRLGGWQLTLSPRPVPA